MEPIIQNTITLIATMFVFLFSIIYFLNKSKKELKGDFKYQNDKYENIFNKHSDKLTKIEIQTEILKNDFKYYLKNDFKYYSDKLNQIEKNFDDSK